MLCFLKRRLSPTHIPVRSSHPISPFKVSSRAYSPLCFTNMAPAKSITIILSPYNVGTRNQSVGAGLQTLLQAGFIDIFRDLGISVRQIELDQDDNVEGEIGKRFEFLRRTSRAVTTAIDSNSFPIILAGNCMSTVGVSAGIASSCLAQSRSDTHGCVWFDAHDDFNTPDNLSSGYFDSTCLSMLVGQC